MKSIDIFINTQFLFVQVDEEKEELRKKLQNTEENFKNLLVERDKIHKDYEVASKNISSILMTAKMELKRRDERIVTLTKK